MIGKGVFSDFLKPHRFRQGFELTVEQLIDWELEGLSDAQMAIRCGVSRAGFIKVIRRTRGWMRTRPWERSDKGKRGIRVPLEVQRAKRNAYMRKYREDHYEKCQHPTIRIGKNFMSVARYNATLYVLDRALTDKEVVHHKDGDTRNNTPSNLLVFASQADRLAYHRGEDVSPITE